MSHEMILTTQELPRRVRELRAGDRVVLIAKHIKTAVAIVFDELGCESVKRMTVEDFAVIVAIDSQGNDLYQTGREAYLHG